MDAVLSQLQSDDRATLERLGRRYRFPAGATLFVESDEPTEAIDVVDGLVKITVVSPDGHEVITDVVVLSIRSAS